MTNSPFVGIQERALATLLEIAEDDSTEDQVRVQAADIVLVVTKERLEATKEEKAPKPKKGKK